MIPRLFIDVKGRATEDLADNVRGMSPQQCAKITGPRLRQTTRDHIKRLPKNKKGWPSTGFWEDAARGTTWEALPDGVRILVNKLGFRQRFHGGVIRAVARDFLTLPIAAQAYGKTVADFPGAFLLRTRKGAYIVQYGQQLKTVTQYKIHNYGDDDVSDFRLAGKRRVARFKGGASLEFLFKLQASVKQAEMPWIIPDATTLHAVAFAALRQHQERLKKRQAGGAT